MDFNTVKEAVINAVKTTIDYSVRAAQWTGRTVKVGFTDYIIPTVKSVWAHFVAGATAVGGFLRNAITSGNLFAAAAFVAVSGVLLGVANKLENQFTKGAFRVAGVAAALAGAATIAFKAMQYVKLA